MCPENEYTQLRNKWYNTFWGVDGWDEDRNMMMDDCRNRMIELEMSMTPEQWHQYSTKTMTGQI